MNLSKRMEAIESALAKQRGESGIWVVTREDGETDDQARDRLGLIDWSGQVVFLGFVDAKL